MSDLKICPCCKRPMPADSEDTHDFSETPESSHNPADPRRAFPRTKKVAPIILRAGETTMEAVTIDVSEGGARIFYLNGYLPINCGVLIDSSDGGLKARSATTVWSVRQEKTYSISGVKFC